MITEMNRKIISISSKRQLTIPGAFFAKLGFGDKAECIIRDNELVIRPARIESKGEFAEEILSDLIREGYSGQELLEEFKVRQSKVRPAIKKMIDDAHRMATGELESMSYDDVFGGEE
ncbi:AbrB/MazE/SpoVT family DNA-binding domain-containing protein [[Clostridium] aminophilum]|uniref:AbrB/MazE/SpoVT family DNA-binding domain-containing protein n=1 Tax=[Clostridium] aminophilum TaxID=1526 RepID=UPI003F954510